MPNKLSTWIDICVTLIVSLILLVILFQYNWYIFSGGIVLWICLFFYLKERSIERRKNLKAYYENVIKNVNELSNYALEQLPQVIMVINKDLRSELALKKEDFELFETSIVRCIDIIHYLDETLDMKYPISRDLHRLYDYFSYMLNRVRFGRNSQVLEQVKPQIVDLRDTFRKAQEAQNI